MHPLAIRIRREIEEGGLISFARFMDLALYTPNLGYYERQQEIGRKGDFYTSVSTGSLFGELLAFRFASWLESYLRDNPTDRVQIVEAGAHRGLLAADVLHWLQLYRAQLYERVNYVLIEPSPVRREWQKATLADFLRQVHWFSSVREAGESGGIHGIIFSNELVDAMPVHRLRWNAKEGRWGEWGVGLEEGGFVWEEMELSKGLEQYAPVLPEALRTVMPDGFTYDLSPAALEWWKAAARSLTVGKLLTIDYGFTDEELLMPERSKGTVRAYAHHRQCDNVLANVGEQDITAHVNFTLLEQAGEVAGLKTEAFVSQAKFLMEAFEQAWREQVGSWTPVRLRQLQTLTHPEHLGRAFRVLIQSRA